MSSDTVVEVERLKAILKAQRELWADGTNPDDRPLPEDAAIDAAHPMETGEHELYTEALRMVGAKRSKYALVDLVNWLLLKVKRSERDVAHLKQLLGRAHSRMSGRPEPGVTNDIEEMLKLK